MKSSQIKTMINKVNSTDESVLSVEVIKEKNGRKVYSDHIMWKHKI